MEGGSYFISVMPSSEYEYISFSTIFILSCCLSVPEMIRFRQGF